MIIFKRPLGLVLIVLYKGISGLLEIVVGFLAFVSSFLVGYVKMADFFRWLFTRELLEDPGDIFANWLIVKSPFIFTQGILLKTSIVLIIVGLGKLILTVGIWLRSMLIRNLALLILLLTAAFGIEHLISTFSWLGIIFLIIDLLIIYYLWKIYPKHISRESNFPQKQPAE